MTTVGEALADATRRLRAAGIDGARVDARALLAHLLGVEPMSLFSRPERPLAADEIGAYEALVARRCEREPLAHILGGREFWSLPFRVTADTLDPRPDTELVVETTLELLGERDAPWRLLDLGTGTGCILLALLSELPRATGLGIDRSPGACAVAADNARRLGLAERAEIRQGEWGAGLDGCFDAIVSNPPYIPDDEVPGLQPEVSRFEPRAALCGGRDGLDCYRALAPQVARLLTPGGVAVFEVGAGQAPAVSAILLSSGLAFGGVRHDLAGIERCVWARRPRRTA